MLDRLRALHVERRDGLETRRDPDLHRPLAQAAAEPPCARVVPAPGRVRAKATMRPGIGGEGIAMKRRELEVCYHSKSCYLIKTAPSFIVIHQDASRNYKNHYP